MRKFKLAIIMVLLVVIGIVGYSKFFGQEKLISFDYTPYIKNTNEQPIYKLKNDKFEEVGKVQPKTLMEISNVREGNKYKLANSDYYTEIKEVTPATKENEILNYKQYIPFKDGVKGDNLKLYSKDNSLKYHLDKTPDLDILIKDKDKYYVEFNNRLFYVKANEVNLINKNQVTTKLGKDVPVFMYHYFYDKTKGEKADNSNYLEIHNFEKQLQYIKENHVFAMNMDDLELFLDKKINIPNKAVVLTMDDGHPSVRKYVHPLVEKYQVPAVAFLITKKVKDIKEYQNPYMQLESHTNAMHTWGCQGGRGGLMRCIPVKDGVADLKKASQITGGSHVLAYPYGDYTPTAIQILKEAGYTMAFTIEPGKVKPGMDKLLLPRVRMSTNTPLSSFIADIEQ